MKSSISNGSMTSPKEHIASAVKTARDLFRHKKFVWVDSELEFGVVICKKFCNKLEVQQDFPESMVGYCKVLGKKGTGQKEEWSKSGYQGGMLVNMTCTQFHRNRANSQERYRQDRYPLSRMTLSQTTCRLNLDALHPLR